MKTFKQFTESTRVKKKVHKVKSVPRTYPKQSTMPNETDWPPFTPPEPSGTTSLGIAEWQTPIQASKPNQPTPLPKSTPEDPKKKKPTKATVQYGGIETGISTPAS
jgi:hypothetical protein